MKQYTPAAERNREPIAEVLHPELPPAGTVLETASGTGQHIAYFARRFEHLVWQPTDVEPAALASIRAWRDELGLDNLLAPIALDVTDSSWPVGTVEAVININMIHISSWETGRSMLRGTASQPGPRWAAVHLRSLSRPRSPDRAQQRGLRCFAPSPQPLLGPTLSRRGGRRGGYLRPDSRGYPRHASQQSGARLPVSARALIGIVTGVVAGILALARDPAIGAERRAAIGW